MSENIPLAEQIPWEDVIPSPPPFDNDFWRRVETPAIPFILQNWVTLFRRLPENQQNRLREMAGLVSAEVVWNQHGSVTAVPDAVVVPAEELGVRILEETDSTLPLIQASLSILANHNNIPIDPGLPLSARQKQLGIIAIYDDEEPARNYQNFLLQRGIQTMIQTSLRGRNKIVLLRHAIGRHTLSYDDAFTLDGMAGATDRRDRIEDWDTFRQRQNRGRRIAGPALEQNAREAARAALEATRAALADTAELRRRAGL